MRSLHFMQELSKRYNLIKKNPEWPCMHKVHCVFDQIPDKHHCSRKYAIVHIFLFFAWNMIICELFIRLYIWKQNIRSVGSFHPFLYLSKKKLKVVIIAFYKKNPWWWKFDRLMQHAPWNFLHSGIRAFWSWKFWPKMTLFSTLMSIFSDGDWAIISYFILKENFGFFVSQWLIEWRKSRDRFFIFRH